PAAVTKDGDELLKELLAALHARFATSSVKIDCAVSDAKRLMPAFGTHKRKGVAGDPERPHRRTAFVCNDEVSRVPVSALGAVRDEALAELAP
ncbi:hypothetical protein ACO1NJ_13970, partial [Staphylococcus aureus]